MAHHPSASSGIVLTAIAGPDTGRTWTLTDDGNYLVGRGKDCAVQVADQSVSRVQCEIQMANGRATLKDSGSKWGTQVGGRRVDREPLSSGAVIAIGDTELRVTAADAQESSTVAPQRADRPPPAFHEPPARQGSAAGPAASRKPVAAQPAAALDLNALVGRKFLHFQVEALIARAATGIVYRAVDARNDRIVVLKIYWPALFEDRLTTARFLRSMQAMLPLSHEHLIKLYSAGRSQQHCFTASEFVAGESAAQLIARIGIAGMLDWRTVWKIGLGLAQAVEYIHAHNVLHRNLRPNNILIRAADQCVKLGDSMLAKSLDQLGQAVLTQRGEVVGDMYYLSPEQVVGSVAVDQRTDLYSLGATLYALLTGRPPFLGGPADLINKILNVAPDPPTKTHLTIPASFEGVVLRLLAKHPDGRYSNATLVVKDLDRAGRLEGLTK